MTSRERVLAAIQNRKPDRMPMDFGGTAMSVCEPEFLNKMRAALGLTLPEDRDPDGTWVDEAIQKHLEVDLRWVPHKPPLVQLRQIDPAAYEDEKARRQEQRELAASVKTHKVKHDFPLADCTLDDVRRMRPNLPPPPPMMDWYIETARRYREGGYATTFWVSGGFFEVGCKKRGYDQFAMDLVLQPDLVRALFDLWLEEKLHRIDTVVKPLAPYIDLFCYGDDFGLQNGPFMAPQTFGDIIKPYFQAQYSHLQEAAPHSYLFHHSCGSVYKLLDDIVDMGVNVLNPVQPRAADMEPEKLLAKGRGRLCFHGGMDLQQLLPFGSPDDVREEAERRMKIFSDDGGYICAPAHSLPEDVPVENILALFSSDRG